MRYITGRSLALIIALCLPVTCPATTPAARVPEAADELQRFDVYRGDRLIGTHTVSRTRQDGLLVMEAQTRIRIHLLGFEIYRFDYDSRESWDEAGLRELAVRVDDDGKRVRIEGRRMAGRFEWSDGSGLHSHPMPVYPTNHWNTDVLGQEAVLNTLTGKINRVTIREEGEDMLALADTRLPAVRYRYDGQLQLVSWYDRAGRWLAMDFTLDDGSTIRYLCSNCTGQNRL